MYLPTSYLLISNYPVPINYCVNVNSIHYNFSWVCMTRWTEYKTLIAALQFYSQLNIYLINNQGYECKSAMNLKYYFI